MVAQAKKAYSDVDLIKKCAKAIVEGIADGNETKLMSKINNIPLSLLIHQENLAALHTEKFEDVMKDIVDIINLIFAHALNHRQSRELLNRDGTSRVGSGRVPVEITVGTAHQVHRRFAE